MLPYRLLRPTFLDTYIQLAPRERFKIKKIILDVRFDPDPDDIMKIRINYLGLPYVKAYDENDYWLMYFIERGVVICALCGRDSSYINLLEDLVASNPPDPN